LINFKQISVQKKANALGFLAVGLSAVAQFVLAPVIKFYIGAEGLGMWHLLFQTFTYLQIVDLGLSNGIIRELAAAKVRGAKYFSDTVATAMRAFTWVGMAFAGLGGITCFLLPCFIDLPLTLRKSFLIALILFSCWGFFRYRYAIHFISLYATNRIDIFNALNLLLGPGRPLMGMVFLTLKLGLPGVAIGYILVEAIVRAIALKIQKLPLASGCYDHKQFIKMFVFGGTTSVVSLSTLLIFFSSSFIIGWRVGVIKIAIYQSSIALLFLIHRFAITPFSNLLPEFIRYCETGDIFYMLKKKGLYCHSIVMLATFISLVIAAFINKLFVTLWLGEEFFAGYHFTVVYSFFILLSVARHNGYIMYQAIDYLKPMLICHLIQIPINLCLSLILLDKFGLIGIAYAYLLSSLPLIIISQLVFIRIPEKHFRNMIKSQA